MKLNAKQRSVETSASSMADVAFLLLTFFLMTTVIETDKGLSLTLPEWQENSVPMPYHQRNLFTVQINSNDQLLVEGEREEKIGTLKQRIKEFLSNNGKDPSSSDSPEKAIVSLRADRGTSHQMFIQVLDEIQGVYNEIYAERLGVTAEEYRKLDNSDPKDKLLIDKAKRNFPMNISIAEPTGIPAQHVAAK